MNCRQRGTAKLASARVGEALPALFFFRGESDLTVEARDAGQSVQPSARCKVGFDCVNFKPLLRRIAVSGTRHF